MKALVLRSAKDFLELLNRRLESGVFTTEDSVRYTFFVALLRSGVRPEQVILEFPHPAISGSKVDTVIVNPNPICAIEFKYDRANPGGKNQPAPQKAGKTFADFVRLLKFPSLLGRYLVYITDLELARYLRNRRNGLSEVFGLRVGEALRLDSNYFRDRPPTFHKAMGSWPAPAILRAVASEELPQGHHVRVYEIEPAKSSESGR